MALTKVRGFNRGRTYGDLRQIAGGPSVVPTGSSGIAGIYAAPGRGTPWSNNHTGSLQRGFNYVTSVYPLVSGTDNSQYAIYVEDLGLLQDFYTSGGFCVSMKVRYQPRAFQALGSDGTNFICADTTAQSFTTTDLVNFTAVTNTPVGQNVGYANGRVQYVNGTIIAASGSQYITQANAPGGTWTTLTSGAAQSNMSFVGAVFHNGQYYLYGWNSGFGGAVARTSGTTWSLATATMVYNAGSTLNAVEHMNWFDDVGCFLAACTRNRANAAAQAGLVRSVDGTTWTDAFIGGTTTGLMGVTTNGSGTAVAVGYNGFIIVSTDGTGSTWTQVSSGQTTQRFTSVRWYNGEFVAVTQQGGTATSPDGLTWTWVLSAQDLNFGGGVGMELFIHSDGLYSYLRGTTIQMITQKYVGSGRWETINFIYDSLTNNVSSPSAPAGIFFGNPINTGTGFIPQGNNMAGLHMTATGIYPVDGISTSMWTFGAQATTAQDTNWHRVSIVGTSVPSQAVPTFTFRMYLDGNPVASSGVNRAAVSTSQRLYVCTSSSSWNMASDIVVTNFTGPRNVGLTGDMQIRPRALTTDVQAQWEKVPAGAASNAAAAQGNGSVLYATSYVQSSATTDTDVYAGGTQANIPGFKVSAVNVAATFQRLGIPTPTVELSVTEGGSSLPAKSTTLTGSTAENVSLVALYPTKLDGGSWTPETVTTANVQIKRTA